MSVDALKGDITTLAVDAIVNAANSSLLGGGGVDGAIHRAAGPDLVAECRLLHGCKTGEAKITRGYRLPAAYIIHTVGPVWNGGSFNEAELLSRCYSNSLRLAAQHNIKTIAFPCISTGIYGFPKRLAAEIAVATVRAADLAIDVTFVCFDDESFRIYRDVLATPQSDRLASLAE